MSEGLNGKIEARLTEVKAEYEKFEQEKQGLTEKRNEFVSQVSAIDRRVNEINVAEVDLNGRFNELLSFLSEDDRAKWMQPPAPEKKEKKEPKPTTVKKKGK